MRISNLTKVPLAQSGFESNQAKTIAYYLASIVHGISVALLGPTLPDLSAKTHSQISQLSLLFSARSFGWLIGAFVVGRILDKKKGHPLITVMLFISAALAAFIPIQKMLIPLVLIVFLLGISESMIDVAANTLLLWVHRKNTNTYMIGLHFFFGVGGFLAPILLAWTLAVSDDISWSYWILALMMVLTALLFLMVPSPPVRRLENDQPADIRNKPMIIGIVIFFFLWAGAEIGFAGWIFTYALKSGITDKTNAAYLTSAFWGALTLARLVSMTLSFRFKPVQLLYGALIGVIACLGALIILPGSFHFLLIGTLFTGIFMSPVFPSALSFSQRYLKLTGKINSMFFIGAGIGGMTLPWVIGQTIERDPDLLLLILIGTVSAALLILFRCAHMRLH